MLNKYVVMLNKYEYDVSMGEKREKNTNLILHAKSNTV